MLFKDFINEGIFLVYILIDMQSRNLCRNVEFGRGKSKYTYNYLYFSCYNYEFVFWVQIYQGSNVQSLLLVI